MCPGQQSLASLSNVRLISLFDYHMLLTYLVTERDGIIRLNKATTGHEDCLSSLCCLYNTSSKGSAVSHPLYVIDHWDFNTASQDKVGMKRLHRALDQYLGS